MLKSQRTSLRSILRDKTFRGVKETSNWKGNRRGVDEMKSLTTCVTTGMAMGRKRGKITIIPHTYIIGGHKNEKVELCEATWTKCIYNCPVKDG